MKKKKKNPLLQVSMFYVITGGIYLPYLPFFRMEYDKVQSASAPWLKAQIKEEPNDMVNIISLSEYNVKSTLTRMTKFGDKVYLPISLE